MKIKICGLFRKEDIEYVNSGRPDFIGFVFAPGRRQVSFPLAEKLRGRLAAGIAAAGVFVNAAVEDIAALYRNGVISLAQLHGNEDAAYIARLKDACAAHSRRGAPETISVIKTMLPGAFDTASFDAASNADYYLVDSGAGSGKPFNWKLLEQGTPLSERLLGAGKPWFLAGGINLDTLGEAMAFNPFAVDISSGAETDGIKDREKILRLVGKIKTKKENT